MSSNAGFYESLIQPKISQSDPLSNSTSA
jgi:hypothetical protein